MSTSRVRRQARRHARPAAVTSPDLIGPEFGRRASRTPLHFARVMVGRQTADDLPDTYAAT
jgi:hypothetical protein